MTRIVIVGEIYNADLSIGGGPIYPPVQPPGIWPSPGHPAHPIAPGGQPPGYWGGVAPPYPDQGLPGAPPGYWGGVAPPYPDQGLPGAQPGVPAHPWVPPAGEELPPPPEEIASQVVVALWSPNSQTWTVKTAPPVQPAPHG
jgi:putative membrane protein